MPLIFFISKISKVLSPIRLFNAVTLSLWKCYDVTETSPRIGESTLLILEIKNINGM